MLTTMEDRHKNQGKTVLRIMRSTRDTAGEAHRGRVEANLRGRDADSETIKYCREILHNGLSREHLAHTHHKGGNTMKEQTLLTSYGRITLSNARQILEQMDRDAADLQRRIAEFNPQPHPTFCQWLWSLVTTRHTRR